MTNDPPPLDAFSQHEVLHVASIVSDFFDRNLLQHRAVQADRVLRAKAETISALLGDFYQAAGLR